MQEIGIEAYNQELTRKSEILHTLLAEYNDGRRKSFYCLAVNLLPLPKIETIMEELASDLPLNALPLKEKAAYVAALFENDASQERLVLKLRKKPSA